MVHHQNPTRSKAGAKSSDSISDQGIKRRRVSGHELTKFYFRHLNSARKLSEQDSALILELGNNPPVRSLEEAVLVIGLLKESLNPTPSKKDTISPVVSLEQKTLERGFSFHEALKNNPYLRNFEVFKMTVQSLALTNNSRSFNDKIYAIVRNQTMLWTSLLNQEPKKNQGHAVALDQSAKVKEPFPSTPDQNSGPNDLALHSLLIEAQNLADSKRFHEAIKKAEQIEATSPLYPTAKIKIIGFSNQAVQDLRHRAAMAFQNALPVTDSDTKVAYLKEAKNYLETALASFPHAPTDQIDTLKENLAVISRDLESISVDP